MPLLVVTAVIVAALCVGALFLQPILKHTASALTELTLPLAGALSALEDGLTRSEHVIRARAADAGRQFISDSRGRVEPNWPWRRVTKPFMALLTFVYLATIDLYLAALAFAAFFESSAIPHLGVSLPLLMGLLWPGLSVAWAEALTDATGARPREPYEALTNRTRKIVVAGLWLGLLSALVGNVLFFVWRQGQLATVNPFSGWTYAIAAIIGALLLGALCLSAAGGLPFLALLVPVVLVAVDGVLLALRGAAMGLRFAFMISAAAGELVITSLASVFARAGELGGAGIMMFTNRVAAVGDMWETRALARADREAARWQDSAATTSNGLRHQVGHAVVSGSRSFWHLVEEILVGMPTRLISGLRDFVILSVRSLATAVVATVQFLIVDVLAPIARAFGGAVTDIARFVAVSLSGFGVAIAAVGFWLFYLPSRITWTLWNWICRFAFASRLHFEPLPDPPPKARLDARIAKLDVHGRERARLYELPLEPTPVLAQASSDAAKERVLAAEQ